jgi:hypothetical protein
VGAAKALMPARGRVAALAALMAVTAVAPASDETLRITGQCREGQPQGGYALRSSDGRLRVQGAFNQGHRVGSFIFWTSSGVRVAHLPFDADQLAGTVSLWYAEARGDAEPARKLEATYRAGERDGETRSWYPDGRLRAEYEYAAGALRGARAWDAAGAPLDEGRARALAERDRAADADYVDTLLAIVKRHLPDCAPPPVQQRAGLTPDTERSL